MQKRILTGAVALIVFIPVLYFSGTYIFPAVIGLLSGIAVYEFARCIGIKKMMLIVSPVILTSAILPVLARYAREWLVIAGLSVFIYLLFILVFGYGRININSATALFFGFVYVAVAFMLLVMVRDRAPERYLLIFITAWGTDTFAYFGGYLFGKKKLCPELSPKKTVEGAICGVAGTVICFAVYLIVTVNKGGDFPIFKYSLLAILASIVSQLGDLSASAIKRHYGIKDFGDIFPGHGGVLDRFDSILPLSIGAYLLLSIIKVL
ncbi:MAG: phosphatidate cytidylyltransferase [Eubacteriales bacterium]|nr:phosphatidate cytidylyltransferase [Eubacteriales bacterium]MDD4422185.1 phosphatidate cytidylyltransferase [Eubacteriales bacterium]HBR31513.1 phosphatidate cytidylyltransferase [Clostridiales bacterium]